MRPSSRTSRSSFSSREYRLRGVSSFIGSNVNLIAPVTVGENALLAAGSTITDDVEDGDMGNDRSRQQITGTTQLQIIAGDRKSIAQLFHLFQPLSGFRILCIAQKKTIDRLLIIPRIRFSVGLSFIKY